MNSKKKRRKRMEKCLEALNILISIYLSAHVISAFKLIILHDVALHTRKVPYHNKLIMM